MNGRRHFTLPRLSEVISAHVRASRRGSGGDHLHLPRTARLICLATLSRGPFDPVPPHLPQSHSASNSPIHRHSALPRPPPLQPSRPPYLHLQITKWSYWNAGTKLQTALNLFIRVAFSGRLCLFSAGAFLKGTTVGNGGIRFRRSIPPNHTGRGSVPTLLYLHGTGL